MTSDLSDDPTAGLPPAMAEIVEDFQALPERERLQLLLEFSQGLRPLPAEFEGASSFITRDDVAGKIRCSADPQRHLDAAHLRRLLQPAPDLQRRARPQPGVLGEAGVHDLRDRPGHGLRQRPDRLGHRPQQELEAVLVASALDR